MNKRQQPPVDSHTRYTLRLVASYSIILLIILVMGIYLYTVSIDNLESSICDQNFTILQNSINRLDNDFASMSSLANQLVNDSKLVLLANMEYIDDNSFYFTASQVKDRLSTYVPSNMLLPIDSYFIYLPNTNYLIAFNDFEKIDSYYNKKRHLSPSLYEEWTNMLVNNQYYYKIKPISAFSYYYTASPENYYYIMPLNDYSFKKIPAILYFELDYAKIIQLFSNLDLDKNGFLYVTNESGDETIFSIGKGVETFTSESEDDILKQLSTLDYNSKNFSAYTTGKNKMLVTHHKSDYNHWNYYLLQSNNTILQSLESYRFVFLLCISFAVFLGFGLIFLLSRRNSKPLFDMSTELNQSRLKQKQLMESAEQQKPLLRRSYIRQIMKGRISTEEEMNFVKEYLQINDTDKKKYQVLYCTIYVNKYEVETSGDTIVSIPPTDYEDIITSTLQQFFGEPLYLITPHERSYALLLTLDMQNESGSFTEKIEKAFTDAHNYLIEHHDIWIFGGLGNKNSQLNLTWKSYQQAKEALRYTSNEHFFQYYDDIRPNSENYYYPSELATQLSNFVETDSKQQIAELFKLIRKENVEKRKLSKTQLDWLLSDIRNTLLKVRFTIREDSNNQELLPMIDSKFENNPSLKLYEDIALILCGLIHTNNTENQLISDIKEYISHKYQDPSLCLSKISEEFSISESYFSYLFKKTTGINFSTYLENIRMEQAQQLVKHSNTKINELYLELGYNNANSFRRAFKKTYGISPTMMREASRP